MQEAEWHNGIFGRWRSSSIVSDSMSFVHIQIPHIYIWGIYIYIYIYTHTYIYIFQYCREPLWKVLPVTRSWRKYRAGKAVGPHPWWGHTEKTWEVRPSRIRDFPDWPRPLPYPISSPLFCCYSYLPCCRFLCCLPRALLLLFHWMKTNLKAN